MLSYLRWRLKPSTSKAAATASTWVLLMAAGLMVLAMKEDVLLIISLAAYAVGGGWLREARPLRSNKPGLLSVAGALLVFALLGVHILGAAERHGADIGWSALVSPVDMAEDERRNRLQILATVPSRSALGRDGLVVDWVALDKPAVLDWLRLKAATGASLVIDPRLCRPADPSARCQAITLLERWR